MRASVIIPVYASDAEGVRQLRLCVEPLRERNGDVELIVVDDGSPRLGLELKGIVERAGGRYVAMAAQSGPAMARNHGAKMAGGEVLIFFDGDTVPHEDTVEQLLRRLETEPELAAVIGSYDEVPEARGLVSEFRNLLHCFVHHESAGAAQTFWTGCGAVRRVWFEKVGGFSQRYREPSIEDVEFGYRVTAAGGKIWLDPTAQVQHLKRWTLESMVKTDLWKRAVPWTKLMREHPLPEGLNFSLRERLAALAVAGMVGTAGLALWTGWWWLPLGCAVVLAGLKWKFLEFLWRNRGGWFAMGGFLLLALHLATALAGFGIGTMQGLLGRD